MTRTVFEVFFRVIKYLILVLTISTIFIILNSDKKYLANLEQGLKITIFLSKETSLSDVAKLSEKIRSYKYIESVNYISSDEALKDFQKNEFFKQSITVLEENPLPASIVVKLKNSSTNISDFIKEASALPNLDNILYNEEKFKQMESLSQSFNYVNTVFVIILIIFAILAISLVVLIIIDKIRFELDVLRTELILVCLTNLAGFILIHLLSAIINTDFLSLPNFWQTLVILLMSCITSSLFLILSDNLNVKE